MNGLDHHRLTCKPVAHCQPQLKVQMLIRAVGHPPKAQHVYALALQLAPAHAWHWGWLSMQGRGGKCQPGKAAVQDASPSGASPLTAAVSCHGRCR